MLNRYSEKLTHLRYDCVNGWPYDNIPIYVAAALGVLVILVILVLIDAFPYFNFKN